MTTEDIILARANARYRIALKFAEKALSGDVQGCTAQEAQAAALEVVRRAPRGPNWNGDTGRHEAPENATAPALDSLGASGGVAP